MKWFKLVDEYADDLENKSENTNTTVELEDMQIFRKKYNKNYIEKKVKEKIKKSLYNNKEKINNMIENK